MENKLKNSVQWSHVVQPEKATLGSGFKAFRLHDGLFDGLFNPLLNIDHFFMSQPTFPPHPHAGFSAITYIFEDSENSIFNRDSLGDKSIIKPGDLHYAQAGHGILHEETPLNYGSTCHGLQIFMNLPRSLKKAAPKIYRISNEQIPRVMTSDEIAEVKIAAGKFNNTMSSVQTDWPTDLLQMKWHKDGSVQITLEPHQSALILNMSKTVQASNGAQIPQYAALAVVNREIKNQEFAITASKGSDVVILKSQVIDEPSIFHGPFVATDTEELNQIINRYRRGEFGHLLPRDQE